LVISAELFSFLKYLLVIFLHFLLQLRVVLEIYLFKKYIGELRITSGFGI